MTNATNQKTNELRDFEGHIYGAIVALLGAALLGYWGQTWAPVIAWAYFAVGMGTVLFLIVKVGDFIEKKCQKE